MIRVAVNAPLQEPLSYLENSDFEVTRGDLVNVSLGRRQVMGVVLGPEQKVVNSEIKYKSIISKENEWPRFDHTFLSWLEWIADYYIYPLGQVAQLALPPLKKLSKPRASTRSPVIPILKLKEKPNLTEEQKNCLANIRIENGFAVHLIHGVTGSGKTEIYLRLFEDCINQSKKGIFLLPEISLTPQLVNRFVERFGEQVAVLHSQLTDRERTNQWWEIIQGTKKVLIGARSALFCPIQNLGLIVVDEEHETSFKQDEKLKYNGRDAAVMLAKFNNCTVLLGSATPSLESWKNQLDGKYQLQSLKSRVTFQPMPQIDIIDMRLEKENEKRKIDLPFWLSQNLFEKMIQSFELNEQTALLLNRRGLANLVFCRNCGYSAECPNCDVSLILHAKHHLICHYCDYHENYKLKCPDCSEGELVPMGLGTEKIEEDIKKLFPTARVARADRDEISNRAEMEQLISEMENSEIDILIGTQMIAKGLDFPKLNLVGLVLADVGFNLPDFRATEKSFQLILQMSGRSGRHLTKDSGRQGLVVVQTYNTHHDSLLYAQKHDYLSFAEHELAARRPLNYPPYQKMIIFRIQSMFSETAQTAAQVVKSRLTTLIIKYPHFFQEVEVLGPAFAPLSRIKNQYRLHVIIKGVQAKALNSLARQVLSDEKWIPNQCRVIVDVDPASLL
jgi:primosomal protein N' (replication factor Y) (superfamily II helicase)